MIPTDPFGKLAWAIGATVLMLGGPIAAVAVVIWLWDRGLTFIARTCGKTSMTYWDVFCEMYAQKKFRWQKEDK